jgi:predicted phosphohydrolase
MAIYALADLHLSLSVQKPMDIFGDLWKDHAVRIRDQWHEIVHAEDAVLLPGDLSWAMTIEEATADLTFISQLPGKKIMIRGNHDYWWSGISKIRQKLVPGHFALQNDAMEIQDHAICGTRGWLLPSHPKFNDQDQVIYKREGERLRLSLEAGQKLHKPIICMMHYPPCNENGEETIFTELLNQFGVQYCVYGHLHGGAHRYAFEGTIANVQYRLVSADYLQFSPLRIT